MKMRDNERHKLAEIERRLTAEDPRLARALSGLIHPRRDRFTLPLPAVVLFFGLCVMLTGVLATLLPLIFAGSCFAVAGPLLANSEQLRGIRLVLVTGPTLR